MATEADSSRPLNARTEATPGALVAVLRLFAASAVVSGLGVLVLGSGAAVGEVSEGAALFWSAGNFRFMAVLWCAVGVVFWFGAPMASERGVWRLLRLLLGGIVLGGVVRGGSALLVDPLNGVELVAAGVEMVAPTFVIGWRERYGRGR